jgi:hypothetical protein
MTVEDFMALANLHMTLVLSSEFFFYFDFLCAASTRVKSNFIKTVARECRARVARATSISLFEHTAACQPLLTSVIFPFELRDGEIVDGLSPEFEVFVNIFILILWNATGWRVPGIWNSIIIHLQSRFD